MSFFIEKCDKEILTLKNEIDALEKLKSLAITYPDLKECKFNGRTYVSSKYVNQLATEFQIEATSWCDSDPFIFASFYKEVNGVRVYADPHKVCIGQEDICSEFWENNTWRAEYQKMGLSKDMVMKTQSYIDSKNQEKLESMYEQIEMLLQDIPNYKELNVRILVDEKTEMTKVVVNNKIFKENRIAHFKNDNLTSDSPDFATPYELVDQMKIVANYRGWSIKVSESTYDYKGCKSNGANNERLCH